MLLMPHRDLSALGDLLLVPKLLHNVHEVDSRLELLGLRLEGPFLPLLEPGDRVHPGRLSVVEADAIIGLPDRHPTDLALALLRNDKMGLLMPKVRALTDLGVPGIVLDLSPLADTPPYGEREWRPRTREDLAELRAAAGCPLWLFGVCSPADAEVAAEAGLEGVVVYAGSGRHVGGPATIELLPDIFDAVAGMTGVYAGGPVQSGVDVFRYLAVGAEAVVVDSDRAPANLLAEFHYAMRLTGCRTLADIGYDAVFAPLFEGLS